MDGSRAGASDRDGRDEGEDERKQPRECPLNEPPVDAKDDGVRGGSTGARERETCRRMRATHPRIRRRRRDRDDGRARSRRT